MKESGVRVLVVDDELEIVELLGEYLRARGLEVHVAADGEAALSLLEQRRVDAVITDLRMPGIDGLELLRHLRERGEPIAVLLMTGYGSIDSAVAALKQGAQDYILKPFRLRKVHGALLRAVEQVRKERETIQLRGVLRVYDAAAEISADTLPTLYQQVCNEAQREYNGAGVLLAFHEPAIKRWVEVVCEGVEPFARLDLDGLGASVQAGGPPDPAGWWFGPPGAALIAAPIRVRRQAESPPEIAGVLALAGTEAAGPGVAAGLRVYAAALGDALSCQLLSARLLAGDTSSDLAFGVGSSPSEHRQRVMELIGPAMQTMSFSRQDRVAIDYALFAWSSGVSLRRIMREPLAIAPRLEPEQAEHAAQVLLAIPERYGGMGAPKGLSGREIPLPSCLLAIAGWWDRVTRASAWLPALSIDEARVQLEADAGQRFHPQVASVFLRAVHPAMRSADTLPPDDDLVTADDILSRGHWLDDRQ
ncbi:MAG: response regulator [Alphaproteobacteria bacterium]|nr:response regulator [Alphaproteobacteria bacterium]